MNLFFKPLKYCSGNAEVILDLSFITKMKSAKQSIEYEVRIRAILEQPNHPRERLRFYLGLHFDKASYSLRYQFGLRRIYMAISNGESIKKRVKHVEQNSTNSSFYIFMCVEPSCESIYVG